MSTQGQIVAKNGAPAQAVASICTDEPFIHLNPCELEIDLFCKGMRIDPSCALEDDARFISRTRAGLGSGLELVIPGSIKDVLGERAGGGGLRAAVVLRTGPRAG